MVDLSALSDASLGQLFLSVVWFSLSVALYVTVLIVVWTSLKWSIRRLTRRTEAVLEHYLGNREP